MTETTFKDVRVTKQAVVKSLEAFASLYPNPNDYDHWLDKQSYRYAIDYEGKLYPPKHILSEITGISTTEYSGGYPTNRVFIELGFTIINK